MARMKLYQTVHHYEILM